MNTKFLLSILVLGTFTTVSQSQADAPVFEPLFSPSGVQTSVDERAPEGTLVLSVRAQGSAAETILYGIELPSAAAGVFVVDLNSGDITVGPNGTDMLVIRGGNPTTFMFQAFAYYSSAGPSGERAYLMVTVDVRDFNDPPLFVDQETDLAVTEGTTVGYVVYRFTATDNDMSSNGAVIYSLEELAPSGSMASHFTIQPFTGDLIVAESLNLDELYQLRISATDEGVPPLNASLLVTVRVNPAPPLFNDFIYFASILEFNSEEPVNLTTVSARDVNPSTSPGVIQYGVLTWSPLNNEIVFAMDRNSGLLSIAGNVDREAFSRYVVTVTSYEQGYPGAFSEASVVVDILNVNEPPRFLSSHYGATVSEGAGLGEVVFSGLEAVDPDEGDSTGLSYSILELEALQTIDGQRVSIEEPLFSIEPSTGVISLNGSLERDARERGFHYYEITVVATDGVLSASTVVAVAVVDVNDNPPIFNNTSYSFSLPENEPAGSQVGEFLVSDSDEGVAAALTFIVQGVFAERFDAEVVSVMHPILAEIRPPTVTRGRIVTRLPLDREETENYSLYIIAMDTSGTPLNATVPVAVTVLDRNDNVPKFSTSNFTFEVPEDAELDTLIMEFNVTDADVGSNQEVDYILEEGVAQEQFSLVPSGFSTRLLLDGPLDRESVDLYSFRIFATDRGMPPLIGEARIYINVTDVNDNPPVFDESPYRATVSENTPVGTEIVTVSAIDQDIGLNGLVLYWVFPGQGLEIQNETGVVTLATELDFETMNEFSVLLLAVDLGGNFDGGGLFDNTTIIITIVDVNDNAPVFENAPITFSVSEAAAAGAEVDVVVATDLDSGSFGEVTYNITGGNEDRKFLLNIVTGSLLVADSLDREAVDMYSITVEARDGGDPAMSSETVITIAVLDVNDNAPEFIGEPYLAEVSEGFNGSVGVLVFTLSAMDSDDGSNAVLRYSITGSGEEHFTVNETTGEIRVSSEGLDYERVLDAPFVLAVTAFDLGSPSRLATTTLNITVLDENDHLPVFIGAPYTVTVAEEITGPRVILTVLAIDQDVSSNGEIVYSGGNDIFSINPSTGEVSLVAGVTLDRELRDLLRDENGNAVYTFTVTAMDMGSPVQSASASVSILVSDINDNSPVFLLDTFYFQISEGLPVGAVILNLLATDADFGSNAEIDYSIVSQQPTDYFDIGPTGDTLVVSQLLDRELFDTSVVTVQAIDLGGSGDSVIVNINITDANDNRPIFQVPLGGYSVSIPEDAEIGLEVITVVATDLDQGTNMEITYAINIRDVPFTIDNPSVGLITVSGPLDREKTPEYQLQVMAMDSALDPQDVQQSFTLVTVTLLDLNDNAPVFGSMAYIGMVQENAQLGTTVEVVPPIRATDADIGVNAQLTFSLQGPNSEAFQINPSDGVITTNAVFDQEANRMYPGLILTVRDDGGMESNVTLDIQITDANDNSPMFSSDSLNFEIPETASAGFEVAIVNAQDLDEGDNAFITYSLSGENLNGEFAIDPLSGAITVAGSLDYETRVQYVLNVTAMDGGDPPRLGYLAVVINIQDENDNAPFFLNPDPSFTVVENAEVGTLVGLITAIDDDTGVNAAVVYAIVGGNGGGTFAIDPMQGNISTNGAIDREAQDMYMIIVEARDSGLSPLVVSSTVTISVIDLNDQQPFFPSSPAMATITEGADIDTEVAQFTAVDEDSGQNAELTYGIVSSLPDAHFTIDASTGVITSAVQLDYEAIMSYTLIISATDNGESPLSGNGTLTITIQDENDNTPEFVPESYSVTLPENSMEGAFVVDVFASDSDAGNNSEVLYFIVGGDTGNTFQIDEISGIVTVRNSTSLDFETTPIFHLQIEARDMGINSLSSQTVLVVTLLDVNDNTPQFSVANQSVSLPESPEVERIILVVGAEDLDEGSNAEITYDVIGGNDQGTFEILQDGTIRTVLALDYETVTLHNLTIAAIDNGSPPLTGTTCVTVEIIDVNDNAPQFNEKQNEFMVSENTAEGTVIAIIEATDADSDENGNIQYRIIAASNTEQFFSIQKDTGSLMIAEELDRETTDSHFVLVEVTDSGSPALSTQKEFTITVLDVDDNLPQFEEPPIFSIPENHPVEQPFGLLVTTDADIGDNADAYYYIIAGDSTDLFKVNETVGTVFLTMPVDRETQDQYTLIVTARSVQEDPGDSCNILTCATTTMTVFLLDVNDNPPVWTQREYNIGVNESAPINMVVGQVQATDADAGSFAVISYEMDDTNATTQVSIERNTGLLRLNRTFDAENGAARSVGFTVRAFDNLGRDPSFSVPVFVTLYFIGEEHLVILTVAQPLAEVEANMDGLRSTLSGISDALIVIYDVQPFTGIVPTASSQEQGKRQVTDESRTNVSLFGVNPGSDELLTSTEVISILENNIDLINQAVPVDTLTVFPIEEVTEPPGDNRRDVVLYIVIGVLGGLVVAICIIFTCTGCILLRRRKNRRKYAPGSAKHRPISTSSSISSTTMPGSRAIQNPMWIDPYADWSDEPSTGTFTQLKPISKRSSDEIRESVLYDSKEFVMSYFNDDSDADNIEDKEQIKPKHQAPTAPIGTKESRSALEAKYQMPVEDEEDAQDNKPLLSQYTHEDRREERDDGNSESDDDALPAVQAELDMTREEGEEEEEEEEEEETDTEEEEEESEQPGEEESSVTAGQHNDPQLDAMEEGGDENEDIDEPLELYMYQDDQAMFEPDNYAAALIF